MACDFPVAYMNAEQEGVVQPLSFGNATRGLKWYLYQTAIEDQRIPS